MKKTKTIFFRHPIIIFLILIVFSLIIISFLNKNFIKSKKQPLFPSPTPTIGWQNIKPGETQENKLKQILGKPIKEYYKQGFKIAEYPSEYKYSPHKIYLQNKTVYLIKEKIPLSKKLFLNNFIDKYGPPKLIMYDYSLGNSYPLNIYPKKGIAIVSHALTKNVIEVWYFPPMEKSQFLNSIGANLSSTTLKTPFGF